MISGLARTIFASGFFPAATSTTAIRTLKPICGAASPTPSGAAACVASERVDLSGIGIEIPLHLGERISSEFLQKSIGKHKGDHRFTDDARRGNHAPVGALVGGLHRLLGDHVSSAEGAAQRGDRLQVAAHDHVFAVGDAAFETAGAIGRAAEAVHGFIVGDFVLHFAAVGAGGGDAGANFDAFDGLDAHYRLREAAVELFVPLCVAAEADGDVVSDDLEDAADGVTGFERGIDFGLHFILHGGINTAQRGIEVRVDCEDFLPTGFAIELYVTDLHRVAGDSRAEPAKQQLGKGGGGDASGGFASGSSFEDVTGVVKVEFLRAGEVRVTGTRGNEFFVVVCEIRRVFDGQRFLPIGPVAVIDAQRYGSADGLAVAYAGEDVGAVLFDFLAAAAAVAELAAMEFVVDEVQVDRKRSGQPGNEGQQRLSVRFTGSVEAQHGRLGRSSVAAVRLHVQYMRRRRLT